MNGTIESTTTDWRGDTLTAALISSDTEIAVNDTADFDEDGGWLTIADADPIEYLTVDEDASTVTLAGAVGAAFEAGDPVVLWDSTVPPTGAKVVEYLASVMTDRGSVDAVIPHEMIPLAGVDRLIGASVALAEDENGEWIVGQILGRDASVDQAYVDIPFLTLAKTANLAIPDGTTPQIVTGWTAQTEKVGAFTNVGGVITFNKPGLYLFTLAVVWAGNSSGRRYIQLVTTLDGVDSVLRFVPGSPVDTSQFAQQIVVAYQAVAGESLRAEVWQTSGAGLDLRGASDGRLTVLQIVRLQA